MKYKIRRFLSNFLITVGVLLFVIGAGYEAVNYPWRLVLSRFGINLSDELADPKPLPEAATTGSEPAQSSEEPIAALPTPPGFFSARPTMNIKRLGSIKLPKISVSENVVEGSENELFYGVGHVGGTALPGQQGNCVLAGHRNYVIMHPFRYLNKLENGDKVIVEDDQNIYTYECYNIFEVTPEAVWVTEPQEGENSILTLITCTPVLNPTHRLIAWCRLTGTSAKSV